MLTAVSTLTPVGRRLPKMAAGIPTAGLVHEWLMEEASGVRYDTIGTDHLTASAAIGSAAGKVGTAASTAAADRNFVPPGVGGLMTFSGTSMTVSLWCNAAGLGDGTANQNYLFSYAGNVNGSLNLLYWGNLGVNKFRVYNDASGAKVATWPTTPTTGAWYHILAWFDGADKKCSIRVDGGAVYTAASATSAALGVNKETRVMGTPFAPGYSWHGLLDQVRVYDRLLSTPEQDALYNGGSGA